MPSRWVSGTAYLIGWVASQTEAANAFSKMSRPSLSSSSLGGERRQEAEDVAVGAAGQGHEALGVAGLVDGGR